MDLFTAMGIAKSHAEEKILALVVETLADAYACLRSFPENQVKSKDEILDIGYLKSRFANEGLSFLTITLPRLGDWMDSFFTNPPEERVEGFKPYNGLFPCFLRPFWVWLQGFSDSPLDAASAHLLRLLRSILHGCKKLQVPYTEDQIQGRLQAFLQAEEDLCNLDLPADMLYAQLVVDEVLAGYTPTCDSPRHGPGVVAGGEKYDQKWDWSHFYPTVHAEWPYWEYLYPIRTVLSGPTISSRSYYLQLAANARIYRSLPRATPTARVLMVPKDSRGPRIISCEPKELMYLQQGVGRHFMSFLERHSLTSGRINFLDQSINAKLALEASKSKEWCTLDLTEASDRVGLELLKRLIPERILRKWLALRSAHTVLPDGRTVELQKFAPMGSALCFPVEAFVFWCVCVGALQQQGLDLDQAAACVFVYGDDIITKNEYYQVVRTALEEVGLVVNHKKSFYGNMRFRESCGIEAVDGFDVTPMRIRKLPPTRPTDGGAVLTWLKYCEESLYVSPRRSSYIEKKVLNPILGEVLRADKPVNYLSIYDPNTEPSLKGFTFDRRRCRLVKKTWVLKSRQRAHTLSGYQRLQRNLIEDFADRDPFVVVDRQSTQIRKGTGIY